VKQVCVSGGADSTALALLLWERCEDFEMVFADTGAELPEVYWLLPRLAQYVGKRLTVVSNGSFFMWLNNQGWYLPGPRVRWCTRLLKQVPQDNYFKAIEAEEVCLGIRADEPQRANLDTRPRCGNHYFVYPLVDAGMDKKDVKALCNKHGLLNPVYQWRSNVSCFCCFFQRGRDWRGLMLNHPTLYEIANEWEKAASGDCKYTWRKGHTLEAMRHFSDTQLSLWPEPEGEPCLICRI
jgi:3'-phosphoadenosine 5'-phosphosulfate sulfotransferase (PAPS reductase)/FAD synthetase